jgi:hypothetical protein
MSGRKSKTSQSQNKSFNETQDTRLSDRSFGMLNDRMSALGGRQYQTLDPGAYKDYMNPFQQEVIDATTADINAQRGLAQNQDRSNMAAAQAFGDDRRGIVEAETAGQYDRTLATTLAGLRSRGFEGAQGVAAGENNNRNQFDQNTQAMINQLMALLGNETTTNSRGTSEGQSRGTGSGFGFGGSWSDRFGFGG